MEDTIHRMSEDTIHHMSDEIRYMSEVISKQSIEGEPGFSWLLIVKCKKREMT